MKTAAPNLALAIALAALTLLAACTPPPLNRPAPDRALFNIEAPRPETAPPARARTVLKVRPLQISPAYQGKEMVYRLGDTRYESDYYNALFVQPAQNLTGETRQWLSRSGLFGNVVDSTSQVADTHLLEGMVNAFYGDFRDKAAPKAVLEVQFFLVRAKDGENVVVFEKSYRKSVPFTPGGGDAAPLAQAWSAALAQVLEELEADIRTALAQKG